MLNRSIRGPIKRAVGVQSGGQLHQGWSQRVLNDLSRTSPFRVAVCLGSFGLQQVYSQLKACSSCKGAVRGKQEWDGTSYETTTSRR